MCTHVIRDHINISGASPDARSVQMAHMIHGTQLLSHPILAMNVKKAMFVLKVTNVHAVSVHIPIIRRMNVFHAMVTLRIQTLVSKANHLS